MGQHVTPGQISQIIIRENIYYSTQTWNLEHFENEFRSTLKETIKTKERKNK